MDKWNYLRQVIEGALTLHAVSENGHKKSELEFCIRRNECS